MIIHKLDNITFRLNELHDLSWLKKYGEAFWSLDETGSGCVCIGMQNRDARYFCKIAGVGTIGAEVSSTASVQILKKAVQVYTDLAHPDLIQLIEHYEYQGFYAAIFEWADGECLFDHWNFETYKRNPQMKSPRERFRKLPAAVRLEAADHLFHFLEHVHKKGYVAVDFYDGSILYDFATCRLTICDIDLFQKAPVINDAGADWFGTKRLKAPEEYILNCTIDEQTNIFTLGALLFDFFSNFSEEDIRQRYVQNRFLPYPLSGWQLSEARYQVALKAVASDKSRRWKTFAEFYKEWKKAE